MGFNGLELDKLTNITWFTVGFVFGACTATYCSPIPFQGTDGGTPGFNESNMLDRTSWNLVNKSSLCVCAPTVKLGVQRNSHEMTDLIDLWIDYDTTHGPKD